MSPDDRMYAICMAAYLAFVNGLHTHIIPKWARKPRPQGRDSGIGRGAFTTLNGIADV